MQRSQATNLCRIAAAVALAGYGSLSQAALPGTAPGAADPLFNHGVAVDQPMSERTDFPAAILPTPNGGALLVGYGQDAVQPTQVSHVVRYRADGTPEPAFGTAGVARLGAGAQSRSAYDGILDASGRILVSGSASSDPAGEEYRPWLARLNADGTSDASFAINGELVASCAAQHYCVYRGLAVQADGRIVLSGGQYDLEWENGELFVDRLLPDGTPDPAFGNGGRRFVPAGTGIDAYSLALDAAGRIVIAGKRTHVAPTFNDALLARLTTDGALDTSFAGSGLQFFNPGGLSTLYRRVSLQQDGRILVAGATYDAPRKPSAYVGIVVRYNADGSPDATFGQAGIVAIGTFGHKAVAQADGSIVVAGQSFDAKLKESVAMAARLLPDGTPDAGFGDGGVAFPHGTAKYSGPSDVSIFADGRIAYAGYYGGGYFHGFAARLIGVQTTTPVVEFYNSGLNHYFITADPNEATAIDQGAAGPGWSRTGVAWKSGGPARVCRFYGSPQVDPATGMRRGPNGHFYTISAEECAIVRGDPGWQFESYDFSAWPQQADAACAAGTVAIKRLYNNRFAVNDSNHRYTTKDAVYADMLAAGWSGEGTVFCAPD